MYRKAERKPFFLRNRRFILVPSYGWKKLIDAFSTAGKPWLIKKLCEFLIRFLPLPMLQVLTRSGWWGGSCTPYNQYVVNQYCPGLTLFSTVPVRRPTPQLTDPKLTQCRFLKNVAILQLSRRISLRAQSVFLEFLQLFAGLASAPVLVCHWQKAVLYCFSSAFLPGQWSRTLYGVPYVS